MNNSADFLQVITEKHENSYIKYGITLSSGSLKVLFLEQRRWIPYYGGNREHFLFKQRGPEEGQAIYRSYRGDLCSGGFLRGICGLEL